MANCQLKGINKMVHIPVLEKEVIEYLDPKPNENFIDGTCGEGGHTLAILEKNKHEGKVLGIELDPQLYKKLKQKFVRLNLTKRVILVNDSYVNLKKIVEKEKFGPVQGVLFDLGLSSWHLEESGRGFTFQKNEPLIMRYDWNGTKSTMLHSTILSDKNNLTAKKILNEYSEKEIEKILREYGEERFAKRIAREIINQRKIKPILNTFQLVEIIMRATPSWYQGQKIHFATRTFQALRIAVNDELNNLKLALAQTLKVLKKEGKLAVISFHSLEDGIVKNFFKENLKVITKKPIQPCSEEIKLNPRSRSAKLRVGEK